MRWKRHRDEMVANNPRHLYQSMRKYGIDNFTMKIIEEYDNLQDCNEAEEFWIAYLGTTCREIGYNLNFGGNNKEMLPETKAKIAAARTVTKASEETKQKMSEAHQGEDNPMFGKNHSEETLVKMSKAKEGKYDGENNPFFGKIHSEETRKLLSEKNIGLQAGENNPMYGRKHSEESKQKMSESSKGQIAWNKGIPMSEETKEKLSKAKMGKKLGPMTPEHRAKIAESRRGKKCPRKMM
jgi:group I intron endonuclease